MGAEETGDTAVPPASEGWTRRFTAIGPRLKEAVELYQSLGYEVRLGPAGAGEDEIRISDGCEGCFVVTLARTVYTRQAAPPDAIQEHQRG